MELGGNKNVKNFKNFSQIFCPESFPQSNSIGNLWAKTCIDNFLFLFLFFYDKKLLLSLVVTGVLTEFCRLFYIQNLNVYILDFNQKFQILLKIRKKLKSHIKRSQIWILKFREFQDVVQKTGVRYELFLGIFYVRKVLKTYCEANKFKLFK